MVDKIREISQKIPKINDLLTTEEATKNALVMPFISALGYNVFDPTEVIPEFTADIGIKKGEKVDYVIKKEDETIMLIECKCCQNDLNGVHASQLHRYFHTTSARFAILTNGIIYKFYTDLEESNKMDSNPFFIFNLLDFKDHQIIELKKFTKSSFSLETILNSASTLKYSRAVKKILEDELENPTENFVKFFASQIYNGRVTQSVLEQFTRIVKDARNQFIKDKISKKFQTALSDNEEEKKKTIEENIEKEEEQILKRGIVTTEDEIEAFHIVKAILRQVIDVERIIMKDTKSYCGILFDGNSRKPICRLHFNTSNKYVGFFEKKNENKIPIEKVDDLYNYSDQLIATLKEYAEIK